MYSTINLMHEIRHDFVSNLIQFLLKSPWSPSVEQNIWPLTVTFNISGVETFQWLNDCSFQIGSPTLKVLHLTDVHWDPEYQEGSNANCREPLCCRATSGKVSVPGDKAGYWGDYRSCDIPWRTIENTVKHMSKQHPVFPFIFIGLRFNGCYNVVFH